MNMKEKNREEIHYHDKAVVLLVRIKKARGRNINKNKNHKNSWEVENFI